MKTIDKEIVKARFGKNFHTYQNEASVQKNVAKRLADTLHHFQTEPMTRALEIGCGTGFLTENMWFSYDIGTYYLNDLVNPMSGEILKMAVDQAFYNYSFLPGDAELIQYPQHLDTIVSSSTVQWFGSLEKFSKKAAQALKTDGILAFSTFGTQNFREIKTTLGVGLDYSSPEELSSIFSEKFDLLHQDQWRQTLWLDSPWQVLRHIKTTGVNGCGKDFLGKEKLKKFEESYYANFSNSEGKVSLTYQPIICVMKARR
ncbi:malonyl-ACP O-methyltransferase BioC [Flammeovirgaceae bacterium SG7u.111]|nr:malonyl-ACP O-methyltransferase BioC [Flammeovirgaceae bacterium SG7u.132]WPO36462.1 malonyl-ACP O-methyltransferase BioC [Flammeovirgaceae bacterium SG7u.111]